MILNNELDRIRFIRELLSAELPCDVEISHRFANMMKDLLDYPDTPEPTLGDHTSGFKEDCCE